jgi:hypothetical protein
MSDAGLLWFVIGMVGGYIGALIWQYFYYK